ncbi:MAG: asparagine synthase (glutamine-hydrolyzing) [Acidobacteriaceae bacterium]
MADAMRLRGPDGWATWRDPGGRLGFAHRRLAILDPTARSDQPMVSPDERYVIVFNGEIYNFKEVRDKLAARGHTFRTTGDTEVLLSAFREFGSRMVDHLRGMYAFAIWDAKEQALFFARDPLGIKPLYYSREGGILRFASQVKALRSVTQNGELDPAGQVGFLLWGSVPEPHTLFRSIRALQPGHTMLVRRDTEPVITRFADVAQTLAEGAQQPISDPGTVREILHDSLRESVEAHMVSDVPVALFLSAGLDSCTIAALVSEIPDAQPKALTLGFDQTRGGPLDESAEAAKVAQQYGIPFHSEYIGREAFAGEHDALLQAMDQPTIDGVNVYFVSRLAHQAGYKVSLSGLGGDEIFAGYNSFNLVPKLASNLKPLHSFPALGRSFRWISAGAIKRLTSPKYAGLLEYGTSMEGAYLLRRSLYMPWELPSVLDPGIVREGWRELEPLARMREVLSPLGKVAGSIGDRLRVSSLEMTQYMRNQLLRDADWAGMAHSVEIRVPLMDYRLLQQLAPLLAGTHAPGKLDMALSPRHRLPASILDRSKTGFAAPVREWLLNRNGQPRETAERGLRGWARHILQAFA